MANITLKIPEDFLLKISRLAEKTDEIVPVVLEAGAEVVVSKVKSNLESVIGKDTKYKSKSTGELAEALGVSPANQDKNGNYNIKIGFAEPRGDGAGRFRAGSNAKIANIIEYGKHGQPPKPFLAPAKTATRRACIETMKSVLESELEKI